MFEGANYFTVYSFLLALVAVQFLSRNFRIWQQSWHREAPTQGSSSSSSADNARSYLTQYMTDLQLLVQGTAADDWQQKLVANPQCAAVPLVAQDVISAPASQAFVERLFSLWSAD